MVFDPVAVGWLLSPVALGLFGLCIGSFLNVVVHRLPLMMERQWRAESAELLGVEAAHPPGDDGSPLSLARPRSRCPHCGHVLRWHENIPLLGWLKLGGRCSACRAPISKRYPLVEAGCGLLFAAIGWRFGAEPVTLLWCAFAAMLLAMSLIDWDTTLLPDSMTQPLAWAGLIAAAMGWIPLTLSQSLWGAVAGYLSLWSIFWLFKLATGKDGMGAGDFKLLAALGAWLGPAMLLPIVLGASLLGAVVGIGMKLSAKLREGRYVPFGPFLAGGGAVVLLAGSERVMQWMGWA
ncbi:A24 family peptidase [Sphaerotilus sp.]|uniref:prepilin peptidase n=1 Tax=Sphaerotilus sp. TaxID=2093942 RepID=UPI002ACE8114|nr:A24 family peptidase [Sphaerotilus sp.]MDZ7855200.1 A24 family peptidase [Sphaerotilus sp.]